MTVRRDGRCWLRQQESAMSETETNLPSVISSEVKADKDEYLGKNETMAANDLKHLPNELELYFYPVYIYQLQCKILAISYHQ